MTDLATRLANLSPAKRRLLETRLKEHPATAEPIAIVGMGCRFPGASSLEEFWELIRDGRCAVSEIPKSRWDVDAYYDPSGDVPGKMSTRWGAFVKDVDQFDPLFFGISPREASRMDPQQRLLLEVAWESLEQAGLSAKSLAGSRTGVFVGIGGTDYSKIPSHYENYLEHLDAHVGTGNALSIAANRLSYIFDFHGPSFAVDTACSSALVALHCAVQSLRNRECDAALAGGVNLILSPEVTIAFSKARMLSTDGVCRPFDASANGYVRGEGCGLVVIKRLTDAVQNGDHVLAVIRGTAVNQDGRTSGITAPNGESQQRVIRDALLQAGIEPDGVSYIEAHGTATPLGDPIETSALSAVFCRRRVDQPACYMTSVKANIGHTETVSGIAGLIKTVLLLEHDYIPPQLHLAELNPNLSLTGSRIEIPTKPVSWRRSGETQRVAGISSFGFGGTNAHVVLEEVASAPYVGHASSHARHLLALSAKDETALRQQAERFYQHLEQHPELAPEEYCSAANTGRTHFNHRLAITGASRQEHLEQLRAFSSGQSGPALSYGQSRLSRRLRVAFLFTGQGSQYVGMGRELFETQTVFRNALLECDELLSDRLDDSLLSIIHGSSGDATSIDETYFTQPAIFAIEYALARLWMSWGIRPDLVLGHSVGEYAAACVAGVFSLEDGIRLIAERGRLMQGLARDGKMAVIFAAADQVAESVEPLSDLVSIAAINGPQNTVISGQSDAVDQLVRTYTAMGIGSQELSVSHAFHSPLMEPILADFQRAAEETNYRNPRIRLISNLSGTLETHRLTEPDYWVDHIRQSVRFSDGIKTLVDQQPDVVVEIGPAPHLIAMANRFVERKEILWVPSLRKGQQDWRVILDSLARLYVTGAEIDWRGFNESPLRRHVNLPTYPFQRSRHWFEPTSPKRSFSSGQGPSVHPLLGRHVPNALEKSLYESSLSSANPSYLSDHCVQGSIVVPAAAYLEISLAAAEQVFGPGTHQVESFSIQQAMFLNETSARTVQTSLTTEQYGSCTVECFSASQDDASDRKWTMNARGKITRGTSNPQVRPDSLKEAVLNVHREQIDSKSREEFYELVAARGLDYGPQFQVLGASVRTSDRALAQLELPQLVRDQLDRYRLHPALLDGCLQAAAQVVPMETDGSYSPYTYMPTQIGRLRVLRPLTDSMKVFVQRTAPGEDTPSPEVVTCEISILDSDDEILVELSGVQLTRIGREPSSDSTTDSRSWLYQTEWTEDQLEPDDQFPAGRGLRGTWLIFADKQGIGDEVARQLERRNIRTMVLHHDDDDPLDGAAYDRLIARIPQDDAIGGIVHLWSMDLADLDHVDALEQARSLGCGSVLRMIQSLVRHQVADVRTWLITRDAQVVTQQDAAESVFASTLWGLGRVATLEHPELGIGMIDVASQDSEQLVASEILAQFERNSTENQIAIRGTQRYVPRLRYRPELLSDMQSIQSTQLSVPVGTASRVQIASSGSIDGLRIATMSRPSPQGDQVEIAIRATGLNFSDVLKALGLYPGLTDIDIPLGIECSGVISRVGEAVDRFHVGQEVIAVVPCGFATHTITHEFAVVPKPANLSFEEAATIPITFMTAHHALCQLADLQSGERVLIHAAAGGVGLAAVQIAQMIGAEIFATAGSDVKREYLRELGVAHVMNSRSLDFAEQILQITEREGIDVVLNSLPGEAIDQSLAILRAYGRFLEIGKTDIYQNRMLGLLPFQDNLSYFAIDLDRMLRQRPEKIRKLLADVMLGFEQGHYRPLPLTTFSYAETREAFRFMAQRKNIGKVIVALGSTVAESTSNESTECSDPRGTYLITGGLGALGRQVADSLADQGVRHIALLSRRAPGEEELAAIGELRHRGVEVIAIRGDVCDLEELRSAIDSLPDDFPALSGVVHAAGVLQDGVLFEMSLEQLDAAMRPKVNGAWNLHRLTCNDPEMEFVLFSSVSSIFGSPGQANYAAGNAFLDSLAHYRHGLGLRATSINWGPWADAGMAMGASRREQLAARGMELLPAKPSLDLMHRLVHSGLAQATIMRTRWHDMLGAYRGKIPPLLAEIALSVGDEASNDHATDGIDQAFRQEILQADLETREALLQNYFVNQLAVIMGLETASIDRNQPLNAMGLDSLMAIELKNQVETRLGVVLPMARFMEGPTVASLAETVSQLVSSESAEQPLSGMPATIDLDRIPLSYGQQALWFLYKLAPDSAAYHICDAVRVRGPLQRDVLGQAIQSIVDRHAAFRTTFHDVNGRPYQRVHEHCPMLLNEVDATDWTEERLRLSIGDELSRPFELETGPLLRVALLQRNEDEHVLVFCLHHIIADFWSLVATTKEFMQIYAARTQGSEILLPAPGLSYVSFVQWQADMLRSEVGEQHWDYWRGQLQGELPVLNLPTDRPRPPVQTFRGALAFRWLDQDLTGKLRELADEHGATLNMLLLATYEVLLHRYSGQDDVIVGLPTSGRARAEFAPLVGYFVNPVPVRGDFSGNPTFIEFLSQIRQRCLGALEHQDFPLSLMVDRLQPERDPSRSTLFQAAFVMQKAQVMHEQGLTPFLMGQSGATLELADLTFESMTLDQWVAQLDVSLAASEANGGTSLGLQYNTDLFDQSSAERMLDHFEIMLRCLIANPDTRIAQIDLISDSDRDQMRCLHGTEHPTSDLGLVHERIASQAQASPDQVAVSFGDQKLSYAELDQRANQLAHWLRQHGTQPNQRIGVCLNRGLDLVVAIQAILRAGAAYVPLDPGYPAQRLNQIAESAGMSLIVAQQDQQPALGKFNGRIVMLDRDRSDIDCQPCHAISTIAGPDDLIYVIYTSGSTGTPKGAGVIHRGFSNLMQWYLDDLGVGANDRTLVITSHGFDLTQKNLFAGLMTGGSVHLSTSEVYDPAAIRQEIDKYQITVLNCTPSHIYGLADASGDELRKLSSLRLIVLGGEAIELRKLETLLRAEWFEAQIVNSYGPTECTDVVIYHRLQDPAKRLDAPVPLGMPIRNVSAMILNQHLGIVPPGAVGELCLAGVCLGTGYINDVELTEKRFVNFKDHTTNHHIYRTGDRCRIRKDGLLEFLGRDDHQVKLRGFRIELGDIEQAILSHPAVEKAVVLIHEPGAPAGSPTIRQLVAYVVVHPESLPSDLKAYLQQSLPPHMIPSIIVPIDSIPLTPHGKLDRRALPKPAEGAGRKAFVPPRTETEELLAELWCELLNQDQVGADDHFFELGGDSLLTVELVSRLSQMGWRCTPAQVFQFQMLSELASALVSTDQGCDSQEPITGEVSLTPIQHWFFELELENPSYFNQSLRIEVPASLRVEAIRRALQAILLHHDALRSRFSRRADGEWQQTIVPQDDSIPFESFDLSPLCEADQKCEIDRQTNLAQETLDIQSGPLLRAIHFECGNERPAVLSLIVHHLVVDPYSMRIILSDLQTAYQLAVSGQSVELPAKTGSMQDFGRRLSALAKESSIEQHLALWHSMIVDKPSRLPVDHHLGENTLTSVETIGCEFSVTETAQFLKCAARAQDESLVHLTAALAIAHQNWRGSPIVVDVERLGRDVFDDIDLSRTVGWCVTMHPLRLDVGVAASYEQSLATMRNLVAQIPRRGLTYGLLRYLREGNVRESLSCNADVRLNYLGQIERGSKVSTEFHLALQPEGNRQPPSARRPHLLEIDARIRNDKLQIDWTYSRNCHRKDSMQALTNAFALALRQLLEISQQP